MNRKTEMEVISKLYGYMDDNSKKSWGMNKAKKMFEDEQLYCKQNGITFHLSDPETLYDTIAHFIKQDREEKHHGHEHWIFDR